MKTALEQFDTYKKAFSSTKLTGITLHQILVSETDDTENDTFDITVRLQQEKESITKFLEFLHGFLRIRHSPQAKLKLIDVMDELVKRKEFLEEMLSGDSLEMREKRKKASEGLFKKVQSAMDQ